jgi:hypothetical protein
MSNFDALMTPAVRSRPVAFELDAWLVGVSFGSISAVLGADPVAFDPVIGLE